MILFVLVCFDTHTAMEGLNRTTYEVFCGNMEQHARIPTHLSTYEQ